LGGLGSLAGHVLLGHTLDDTDSDGLTHVTDGETAERRVFGEDFDAHRLGRFEGDHAGIPGLDELGVFFENLSGTTVHLLGDFLELARNVGGVAIEDRGVSVRDLSRVVKDDDLGVEVSGRAGGVLGGVTSNESTTDFLDGQVLDVESNVVPWDGLHERLVVHFHGLDFGGKLSRGEGDDHAWLEDTGLDTADWNCSDSADLVHILERKTKRLVNRALRRVDQVEGFEEERSLVPRHVGGSVDHVVASPSGNRDEGDLHWLVADLLQVDGDFGLDLRVTRFAVLDGGVVHLVDADNHLLDTEGVSKESVLAGLSFLGHTGLELTDTGSDDKDGNISLGGTRDHVLDEVTVSWGVNDGEVVLGGLELPQSNVNGDTALALGLQVVQDPCVLERGLSEFGSFLLELLDGTLVDTPALVDQVTGGGRLSGVDVADDHQVDVKLVLTHGECVKKDEE